MDNNHVLLLWILSAIQGTLTLVVAAGVRALFELSRRIGVQNARIAVLETALAGEIRLGQEREKHRDEQHVETLVKFAEIDRKT